MLTEPLYKNKDLTTEEINAAFDQRVIQKHFGKIIAKIIERISEETWLEVGKLYDSSFIDLNLQNVLNKSFQIFEDRINEMSKQTSREAWKGFMNRTVISYVQVLFNSFAKIKKQKNFSAIDQIQKDYDLIEEMFSEYMTKRILRPSLEILGDIKNFFETTVDFLTISIGKMRKDHGPAFNITTVKALLSLRTDLQKSEKNKVLALSKELLDEYKDEGVIKNSGIFNNVDIASAAQEFNNEMKEASNKAEGEGSSQVSSEEEEEEIDIGDFLKQGGIELDELDEKQEEELRRSRKLTKRKKKKEDKKIVGREDMEGWLFKSNEDLSTNKGIFDKVLNTVTDTISIVADNVNRQRTKRYFRIKKGHLYWYTKEDSDKAQNDVDIKKIEQLELNKDNPKMIFLVAQNKLYKLESSNKDYVLEWYKSLCLVRSKSEEYLDLNRYVDSQVFEKLSGKSIFRDFEIMLKENAKAIEEQKRKKEEEEKRIRDAEIEKEVKQEIEAKKKKEFKVASK
uniref:PH domain-containing protein n=1 Tax=Euplotes crassus TaxID=5936 RepID=A0A7S3KKK7_EUPCR|mmetsp:Transcript_32143/g.31553  ORF Transcript_32143/g.31553 Transcript_32143/m.31553 type:complete len:510 (+) Transcript_32143:1102-2631(+)